MSGEIRLGGGTKPQDFGAQDATILSVVVQKSKYPMKDKVTGADKDAYQLAVEYQGDNGKTCRAWYGGVYPNEDGSVGFGKGGTAKVFLTRWASAANGGKLPGNVKDIAGTRVHVGLVTSIMGGKESTKLFPDGPARPLVSAALVVRDAPIITPPIDGEAIFSTQPQGVQDSIKAAVSRIAVEEVARSIESAGLQGIPDYVHALAVAQAAKGVA